MAELLDMRSVAGILGISTRTLSRMIARGELEVILVGGVYRFREEDIRRYIDAHRAVCVNTDWFIPAGA